MHFNFKLIKDTRFKKLSAVELLKMKLFFLSLSVLVFFKIVSTQSNETISPEYESVLKAFDSKISSARENIVLRLRGRYTRFNDAYLMVRTPLQAFITFFLGSKAAQPIIDLIDVICMGLFDFITFNFRDDGSRSRINLYLKNAESRYNGSIQEYVDAVENRSNFDQCRNKTRQEFGAILMNFANNALNATSPNLQVLDQSIGNIVSRVINELLKYLNGVYKRCGYWFPSLSCKLSYVSS
jgi:ABC-type multidrug transport system fused ATPase/permease subunit